MREIAQFSELGVKLMKGGMDKIFDTWMLQESDLVQVGSLLPARILLFRHLLF